MVSKTAITDRFKDLKKSELLRVGRHVGTSIFVVFLGYITASVTATMIGMLFIDQAMARKPEMAMSSESNSVRTQNEYNYHGLRKDILARNLFNKDGEVPEEVDPRDATSKDKLAVFDENAPCAKCTLNIELLGTIYLTRKGSSIATIQEKGYGQADVYREGDLIIGNETAKIHKIEQERVVINNNGAKECIELAPPKIAGVEISGINSGGGANGKEAKEEACGTVVLEEGYVKTELGEGFSNILNKGRLIPHNNTENQMVGFKLIGVDAQSLFGKVCLKNGDVITQVNEISLQQPDQGFALYQAFQDDRELRISLLRKGKTPMTVSVQIR